MFPIGFVFLWKKTIYLKEKMKEKLLLDILNIKTKHLHFTTVLMRGSFGNQISYQPRYSLSDDPQNRTFPLGSDFYPPF